eukprot:jgi/Chlat1/7708/Chrsp66S00563
MASAVVVGTMAATAVSVPVGSRYQHQGLRGRQATAAATAAGRPQWSSRQRRSGDGVGLKAATIAAPAAGSRIIRRRAKLAVFAAANQAAQAPLRIAIAGAPASGKGTQCEDIVRKYGLVHVSVGDLLRAEVEKGTDGGVRAKGFMDAGKLVPDDVVVTMVKSRLAQPDCVEHGWLLDGYPRSRSQAEALEQAGIRPQVFILLKVPDERILERVTGRRSDPETGRVYHLTFAPPENEEVAARLVQRSDDTEDTCRQRLKTYHKHTEAVIEMYEDVLVAVDGDRPISDVSQDMEAIISDLQRAEARATASVGAAANPRTLAGPVKLPTKLMNTPMPRYIRQFFYKDVASAARAAIDDGLKRMQMKCTIPETNTEMDVYRIGTLLEMVREIATELAQDGKRVKVCVQGSMGKGVFQGLPLSLSGVRRIMEVMDWGEDMAGRFIFFGAIGAKEVEEEDDVYLLLAPQSIVGSCILPDLQAMCDAAGDRPIILLNPKLGDIPSAGDVMQIRGRAERRDFALTFKDIYHFRLLFISGTAFYPVMGALRYFHGGNWELYKRVNLDEGEEEYQLANTFEKEPSRQDITACYPRG